LLLLAGDQRSKSKLDERYRDVSPIDLLIWSKNGIALSWQKRERVSRFILLSTRARDSIVLRSHFMKVIQHFAARPQRYNTQREDDEEGGHLLISS
jgi:hypothetical protein